MSAVDRDSRLETGIGRLLRAGVLTSSALLLCGLVLNLSYPGAGVWLMRAGVVILIGTPAARVALSFADFVIERNVLFVTLTALVLLELATGVVAALVFHRRL